MVAAIPYPVLGGAGHRAVRLGGRERHPDALRVDYHDNLNMVIVSVAVAVGIIPIAAPDVLGRVPEWLGAIMHSGISAAAIVAVVAQRALQRDPLGKKPGASVMAAAEAELDKLGDTLDDEMKGQQGRPSSCAVKPPTTRRQRTTDRAPSQKPHLMVDGRLQLL